MSSSLATDWSELSGTTLEVAEYAVRRHVVQELHHAFQHYYSEFLVITRRAKSRFEKREWAMVVRDAEERIGLYHQRLSDLEEEIRLSLGSRVHDYALWDRIKQEYWLSYLDEYHADLALIFHYSVMRRIFSETSDSIEYSDDEISNAPWLRSDGEAELPCRCYAGGPVDAALVRRIVGDFGFEAGFRDLALDCDLAADLLERDLGGIARRVDSVEMLKHAFFRNKAAYLIGRLRSGDQLIPLVIVLLHPAGGISIDSVLTADADLANVFTTARSNFHVDPDHYRDVLRFLKSVAPSRPDAYIYSSIGFIHPAKLQLVRELRRHLNLDAGKFHAAAGVRGTVMIVFTVPGFRYVFKVIRDVSSKETFRGRNHVVGQYWRVHRMDRVGRMLDIMTLHNLRFRQSAFEPALLAELLAEARSNVHLEGGDVIFKYVYCEREIVPLDLYLHDPAVPLADKEHAVRDYGTAIKDLAAAGIFVGDYMPKNFGVSRYGRVILYDYDDIDDLVNWNFRRLPDPPEWAEMLPYEDWLSKGEFDVFPEHDLRIFTIPEQSHDIFLKYHADLLRPEFWNRLKDEIQAGQLPDFYPYPREKRLPDRDADAPSGR